MLVKLLTSMLYPPGLQAQANTRVGLYRRPAAVSVITESSLAALTASPIQI